jgi:hypothetical protein
MINTLMRPWSYFFLRGERGAATCFFPGLARFLGGAARRRRSRGNAAQLVEDGGVLERRDVLRNVLATRDRAQQPAHDLAGARLRQAIGQANFVRSRDRTQLLGDPSAELRDQQYRFLAARPISVQNDVGEHRLTLDFMLSADHGRFGDTRMRNQGRLDFHRAQAVAGDVQHVVDAAHDPIIAVGVAVRRISGHVITVLKSAPIRFQIPLVVAPDRAQY